MGSCARLWIAALIGAASGCTDRATAADDGGSESSAGEVGDDSAGPTDPEGSDGVVDEADVGSDDASPTSGDPTTITNATIDTSAGETDAPVGCGDGIVDSGELCDDGNATDGDGCESDCSATIVDIAAGGNVTCVRTRTGALRCWGENNYYQLGLGEVGNVGDDETPAQVGDVDVGQGVVQVVIGLTHTCALLDDGAVRCWGRNQFGEAGYGHTQIVSDAPATLGDVEIGGNVVALTAGENHTCALLDDGGVRCWGLNHLGQLGLGHTNDIGDDELPSAVPAIDLGDDAIQIEAGGDHTCALVGGGAIRCWGFNDRGQLGYANLEPIGDDDEPDDYGESLVGIEAVELAAGGKHTCARGDEGELRCWGSCTFGQCGYGMGVESIGDDEAPQDVGDVPMGGTIDLLAAGATHMCTRIEYGWVVCWGSDQAFQLGYPDDGPNIIGDDEMIPPIEVYIGGPVVDVALGNLHSCALLESGAVQCWGDGSLGALGYGDIEPVGDIEAPAQQGDVPVF
jgi:cysteine-rich repeat protein